jgi:hypothetical protein
MSHVALPRLRGARLRPRLGPRAMAGANWARTAPSEGPEAVALQWYRRMCDLTDEGRPSDRTAADGFGGRRARRGAFPYPWTAKRPSSS